MYNYEMNGVKHYSPSRSLGMGILNTSSKPKKIKLPKLKSFKQLKALKNKLKRRSK